MGLHARWVVAFVTVLALCAPGIAVYGAGTYGDTAYGTEPADPAASSAGTSGGSSPPGGLTGPPSPGREPAPLPPAEEVPSPVPAPASDIVAAMEAELSQMRSEALPTQRAASLVRDARNALTAGDRVRAEELHAEIRRMREDGRIARETLRGLEEKLRGSARGTDRITGNVVTEESRFPATARLVSRAASAMDEEEYALALALALEANEVFAIEEQINIPLVSSSAQLKIALLFGVFIIGMFGWIWYLRARTLHRIAELRDEEHELRTRIKALEGFATFAGGTASPRAINLTFLHLVMLTLGVAIVGGLAAFVLVGWGERTLVESGTTQVRMEARVAADAIRLHEQVIEVTVGDLAEMLRSSYVTYGADLAPAQFLESVRSTVRDVGARTTSATGVYAYLAPERFGGVHYLWFNREEDAFVWEEDTEIMIPDYLRMDGSYRENPDYVWYFGPLEENVPFWSEMYFDTDLGYDALSYVVPIMVDEAPIGVLGMDMSFAAAREDLERASTIPGSEVVLVDTAGTFIIAPTQHALEWDPAAVNDTSGVVAIGDLIVGYESLESGKTVLAIAPREAVVASLVRLKRTMLLAIAGVVLVLFLAGAIIAERHARGSLPALPGTAQERVDRIVDAIVRFIWRRQ